MFGMCFDHVKQKSPFLGYFVEIFHSDTDLLCESSSGRLRGCDF